jgi:hypothetical protein
LLGRDAEGLDALGQQPAVAGCVALGAVAIFMGFAVDLDCKFDARTEEVEHVRGGGVLVAETQAGRALFQFTPEDYFSGSVMIRRSCFARFWVSFGPCSIW